MYKLSYLYKVANTNKKTRSDSHYWLFKTEINSYLFTEEALKEAENRANKSPNNIPSEKMFYPTKIEYHYYLLSGVAVGVLIGVITTFLVAGNYELLTNFWRN